MSIGFYRKGNAVRVPWPDADEMIAVIHDLGSSFDPNELIEAEIDDARAAEIVELLKAALKDGAIGATLTTQDSLGRDMTQPYRVMKVGGKEPLNEQELAKLQDILELCA